MADSLPALRVCASAPGSDNVGQPCSNCGHTGHWLSPCRECMLDIRIAEADALLIRLRAVLEELER